MLQYFINATAIWLISLLLFDALLRKENYHNYNRFYLLFTFLLGAFLPLLQWQEESTVYTATFEKPLQQVISAKQTIQTIIAAPATMATTTDWQVWLTIIYLSGASVAFRMLVIDIIKLIIFYRNGKKSKQDGWSVTETGKEHAPFSFLTILFVSGKGRYSADGWEMILTHEKRHAMLCHFADLLLMQAARIIFWFHPLIYVYNKRLLLVHEFQADNASLRAPQVYGAFLVEQALLENAPTLSHSFNRSPIKKRIVMLTRSSSKTARTKMFVIVPLSLVCILCFSKNSYSFRGDKNKIFFKGNEFEFGYGQSNSTAATDVTPSVIAGHPASKTVTLAEPEAGPIMVQLFSAPVRMNGKKIYCFDEVASNAVFRGKESDFNAYLINGVSGYLQQLNDGSYEISIGYPVIDERGKLVYYDNKGLRANNDSTKVDPVLKERINHRLTELLDDAPGFEPAIANGEPVNVYWPSGVRLGTHIIINDHIVTITKSKGIPYK